MKRVILVHGWEGTPEKDWFVWLKKELEKRGFTLIVPAMPNTMNPTMDEWMPYLSQVVSTPNEDTYLVGHSLGCITILCYLETLQDNQKIGGAVLVAGFGHNLEYKGYENELISFFKTPVDWEKIKKHCNTFVTFHSEDDPYVPVKHGVLFQQKLNAKSIVQQGMGHYNEKEYPIILEELLKLVS